jgi:hypothetical protein
MQVQPNWSFNRSANGWPPGPRGALVHHAPVRRHELGVCGSLFGQRCRVRGWHRQLRFGVRSRRGLKRHLVCQLRHCWLCAPFSCQRRRASAPGTVLLRSRPSAFAGTHRGHPFCQLRLRRTAASAAARCRPSRFVFNSPGALGSEACHCRCRSSWAARSAAPLRLPGVAALNTRNAA